MEIVTVAVELLTLGVQGTFICAMPVGMVMLTFGFMHPIGDDGEIPE